MLEVNGTPVTLKYRFVANFADGKDYEQNDSDVSTLDPTKSCYFDLTKEGETNPITNFVITDGENAWGLHLPSGIFTVGGLTFQLHCEDTPYVDRKLIFFRRRTHDMTNGVELLCRYVIGWEGKGPDGKSEQFKIFVK